MSHIIFNKNKLGTQIIIPQVDLAHRKSNNDIFITKPDKGSGVVILNKKGLHPKNGEYSPRQRKV